MSVIYDIKELHEGVFTINFNEIYHYQKKYPWLVVKLTCKTYIIVHYFGGQNAIDIITYKYKYLFQRNSKIRSEMVLYVST